LDEIRLEATAVRGRTFDFAGAERAYREEFRRFGLDFDALSASEAGDHLRASRIRERLIAALDDWALARRSGEIPDWQRLLTVAIRADDDSWRNRLREILLNADTKALRQLAEEKEALALPANTAFLMARALGDIRDRPSAIRILRE